MSSSALTVGLCGPMTVSMATPSVIMSRRELEKSDRIWSRGHVGAKCEQSTLNADLGVAPRCASIIELDGVGSLTAVPI